MNEGVGCESVMIGRGRETAGQRLLTQRLGGGGSACDAGDVGDEGSALGSGRPPGGGHGSPLQCSCPENPGIEEPGHRIHSPADSRTRRE